MPKIAKIWSNCLFFYYRPVVDQYLEAYLEYLSKVAPDIEPQLSFLKKFHKFLLGVFHDIQKCKELWAWKIMVHGDSKIDNFMFKLVCIQYSHLYVFTRSKNHSYSFQNSWSVEDQEYVALICDWQGVAFDLVSSDIIWTLYGYMKNLPDKNATVDSFMDYSIAFYHKELLRLLELMHVSVLKCMLVMPKLHFKWQVSVPNGFD